MSIVDSVRDHVTTHKRGMVHDLLFAVVWVTVVDLLFRFLQGPQWAYYLCMAGGIVAYFGFFWSLDAVDKKQTGQ